MPKHVRHFFFLPNTLERKKKGEYIESKGNQLFLDQISALLFACICVPVKSTRIRVNETKTEQKDNDRPLTPMR